MTNILEQRLAENACLISDGATGTNLIERGLPRGTTSEEWVLDNPEPIVTLHRDFIEAGADIILTATFGASEIRLARSGLAERAAEINQRAVELARQAANGRKVLIAGSIGPLGEMLKPLGPLGEETAWRNYHGQAESLADAGVDLLLIETQFDLAEASIAVSAALSAGDIPVICSFSFDRGTRTMMGVSPAVFTEKIGKLGVAMLGVNCGKSLEDNLTALNELSSVTGMPIWFKPNAGLPTIDSEGHAAYDVTPDEMASHVKEWMENGARIIGGCCGTSPSHLTAIRQAVQAG